MQGDVVENGLDGAVSQEVNRLVAGLTGLKHHVEHVVIAGAVVRNLWQPEKALICQRGKGLRVEVIDPLAAFPDPIEQLKLSVQEGRTQFAGNVGRSNLDPGVLVDLAAEELRSVRALLANDLGALGELAVVDQQRAAFTRDQIFGLVEAERSEVSDGAE